MKDKNIITIEKSTFKELYNIACEEWQKKFNEKFKEFNFSDTLEFSKDFLIEMKRACTTDQLPVFNKIFSDLLTSDIFKVTTYSEVCKRLNVAELTIEDFKMFPEHQREKLFNTHRIMNLEDFFNEGKKLDWLNTNIEKYFPYFKRESCGWLFRDSYYGYGSSDAVVGFYQNRETSDHVGTYFLDIYRGVLPK